VNREADALNKKEAGEIARLLSYVVLLAVSATLFVEATVIPTSRFEVLGAGAFPMLVNGVLMLMLAGAIVGSVRRIPRHAYGAFAGMVAAWVRARRLVFVVFGCLGAYLIVMPMIGYPIATFVFLTVLQLSLAPRTPRTIALILVLAVIFSFGLNWLFAEVFNVFLPRGF